MSIQAYQRHADRRRLKDAAKSFLALLRRALHRSLLGDVDVGRDETAAGQRIGANSQDFSVGPRVLKHMRLEAFRVFGCFRRNDLGIARAICISHRNTETKTTAFRLYEDGPVKVFYWVDGNIGYAVSGGIDHKVILSLAHEVHAQLTDVIGGAPTSPR